MLIVDDTPESLTLLYSLLKDQYRTQIANSGERALELLADGELPDLLLLDVMMPGMGGFETCRRVRRTAHRADSGDLSDRDGRERE